MYCSKCGSLIKEGQIFCSSCGAPAAQKTTDNFIEEDFVPEVALDQDMTLQMEDSVQPVMQPSAPPQPGAQSQQGKKTKKNKPEKTKNPKKKSAGKIVLSVLLGMILFILVSAMVLLVGVRKFSSKEKIEEMVEHVDLADIDISDITGERHQQLAEFIYEIADESMPGALSRAELRRILRSSETKEYIAGVVEDSFRYILTGKGRILIGSDDIIELIRDNDVELTDMEVEQIKKELEYNKVDDLNISSIIDDNKAIFDKIHFLDLNVFLYVLAAAIALVVIALIAINRRYIERAFLDVAIPAFLSGFVIWILMRFTSYLQDAVGTVEGIPSEVVDLLITQMAEILSGIAVIPMKIGAVSFLLFLLIRGVGILRRKIAPKTL